MTAKGKKKRGGNVVWPAVRDHYFQKNLDPNRRRRYTLEETARYFDLSPGVVRNRASKEGWNDELRRLLRDVDVAARQQIRKEAIRTHTDVRRDQAKVSRALYAVAGRCLMRISQRMDEDPDYFLPPAMIVRLAHLGLVQERKALGVPDLAPPDEKPDKPDYSGWEHPDVNRARHERNCENARIVRELLEEIRAEEAAGDHASG